MAKRTNEEKLAAIELKLAERTLVEREIKKTALKIQRDKESNLNKFIELASKHVASSNILTPSKYVSKTDGRLDIVISDFHYRGKVDYARSTKFFKALLAEIQQRWDKKQRVRISFLGDDVEGNLHLSSIDKHQEETLVTQVPGVEAHYSSFINSVAKIVKPENVEVVFVPESNHGQIRLHGMQRGEQPKMDVGYIIMNYLIKHLDDKISIWESKDGIVETDDAFYMHGDKQYMNSADKVRLTLGTEKHIYMGHFHKFKVSQFGGQYLVVAPMASSTIEEYAKQAGYDCDGIARALIIKHNKKNKIVGFDVIEVE